MNSQVAYFARHAELLAATDYLRSLIGDENRILTLLMPSRDGMFVGLRNCPVLDHVAVKLRNINQNKTIVVSISYDFFIDYILW